MVALTAILTALLATTLQTAPVSAETSALFTLTSRTSSANALSPFNNLAVTPHLSASSDTGLAALTPRYPHASHPTAYLNGTMRELVTKGATLVFGAGAAPNGSSPDPPAGGSNSTNAKRAVPGAFFAAWTIAREETGTHASVQMAPGGTGSKGMFLDGAVLKMNAPGWSGWVACPDAATNNAPPYELKARFAEPVAMGCEDVALVAGAAAARK